MFEIGSVWLSLAWPLVNACTVKTKSSISLYVHTYGTVSLSLYLCDAWKTVKQVNGRLRVH